MCQGQRQRTQHHRTSGHQNRAQPQSSALDHRIADRFALVAHLIGELDDQDAVLGDQPDQRDQTDLAVDIERAAGPLQKAERAGHGQWHGQHDDEGIDEALELGGEHQIDEAQCEDEGECKRRRRLLELTGLAVVVDGIATREVLLGAGLEILDRFTERSARCKIGGDRDRPALREVIELARTDRLFPFDQAGERHHRVIAAAHEDRSDVLRRIPGRRLELNDHVVLLAAALVAGDLPSAEHGLDRAPNGFDLDAGIGRAISIDGQAKFGLVQAKIAVDALQPLPLLQLTEHRPDSAGKLFGRIGGHDDKVDRAFARRLTERGRRHRKGQHSRHRQQLGLQLFKDLGDFAGPLVPVGQTPEGNALSDCGIAGHHEGPINLGNGLGDRLELLAVFERVADGGTIRAIDDRQDRAAIFGRRQLALHGGGKLVTGHRDRGIDDQDQPAMAKRKPQGRGIAAGDAVEGAFDGGADEVALGMGLEELGAHHWRQRQRHEPGHDHRPGQRQSKLDEQPPGTPRCEGHRCIDRRQRQGHGNHREAHFPDALEGCCGRRHAFFDMPVDVFEHDDRIVDHQADCQHQRQQREGVDREASRVHQTESGHQTDRNRDQRNEARPEGVQKDNDDQGDQCDRLENGPEDRLDRAVDEHRVVVGDLDGHTRGQIGLDTGQLRPHGA